MGACGQQRHLIFGSSQLAAVFALATVLALMALTASAQAQTYTVLHNFTGGADGAFPYVSLSMDGAGNLYGVASLGGLTGACNGNGCGTVYKLTQKGSGWILSPLYAFTGGSDGATPYGRVIVGPNGTLYGTTYYGGNYNFPFGSGVVFNLRPPAHNPGKVFSPWTETVLHQFTSPQQDDGANPQGPLAFDPTGVIYGTTFAGGIECYDAGYCGTVYQLTPNGSGWTEKVLHEFNGSDGAFPQSGVILDPSGNLYGTTWDGQGTVFELARSGSGWTEHIVYQFGSPGQGYTPAGGLLFDPAGNLYGATQYGGPTDGGSVYQLKPSGGGWTRSDIYSLTGGGSGGMARDTAGNLYGTTCEGGAYNSGTVYKLIPSGGGWTQTVLHDFTSNDGYCPLDNVIVDAAGNIYGTTWAGGSKDYGVAFKIAP